MRDDFLKIDRVSKSFNADQQELSVLENISLVVPEGKFVAIVGPSGCGKTTLLRIVAGLIKSFEGEVHVHGNPVSGPGPDRGMIFQSYTSFPWLTVKQNIEFGLTIHGATENHKKNICNRLLETMGLSEFSNSYPETLSGGMKQRVAIARTLANNPAILLMDEPFGALDYQTRWSMQELFLKIWEQEKHKTALFVTHDIEEALFLADSVIVMTARPGRIQKQFTVPFERPRKMLLKADPEFVSLKSEIIELIQRENSNYH